MYCYITEVCVVQEAAEALLSAQQVGCVWPNITEKVGEYLGRAEQLKQLRGDVDALCSSVEITVVMQLLTINYCCDCVR